MELVAEKGGKGRVALDGLSFRLIDVDDAVYINGSTAFYSRFAGVAAARRAAREMAEGAPKRGRAAVARLAHATWAADEQHARRPRNALARPTRDVDGQAAVGVSDTGEGGTLYVAATGAPYPLEIVKRGAGGGKIVFDRWNQARVACGAGERRSTSTSCRAAAEALGSYVYRVQISDQACCHDRRTEAGGQRVLRDRKGTQEFSVNGAIQASFLRRPAEPGADSEDPGGGRSREREDRCAHA